MPTDYALYLRKSRADLEAEAHGEGDTLARHEHILMELAKSRALPIGAIYREIVSGERIANRPVMQQLLSEVEDGRWKGVLVTETSRLARGDTIDQGIVAQAFKFSGTLIVTPAKTYDPTQEADEEWMEFGLFMSRQEYRMIRRRMNAGTKSAKKEGRYVGSRAPYGYERCKLHGRGWSIRPIEPESVVVKMIYELFLSGKGAGEIATYLNQINIPSPTQRTWVRQTVGLILQNPHYAGLIPDAVHPYKKVIKDGQLTVKRPLNKQCELYEGVHEAIIPRETWEETQRLLTKNHKPRVPSALQQHNPLAGLLYCDKCGQKMQRHPQTDRNFEKYYCPTVGCPTVSAPLSQVEALVLQGLKEFLYNLEMQQPEQPDFTTEQNALKNIDSRLVEQRKRLTKTFELVEDGIYTREAFLQRQSEINAEISRLQTASEELQRKLDAHAAELSARENAAPQIQHVLDVYDRKSAPAERSALLKQVIDCIDYHKTTKQRWSAENDLSVTIHPKISARK